MSKTKGAVKKKEKNCYVVTRRILVTEFQARKIDKEMEAANRLYNMGVTHCSSVLDALMKNTDFSNLLHQYQQWRKTHSDTEKKNPYQAAVSNWLREFQLNEYDIQKWLGAAADKSFHKCINSAIVQKLASNLYSAVRKVIFSSGKRIHRRKCGQTNSLEGKSNKTGIIYSESTDTVSFSKMQMSLKPVRKSDRYLQEAMANGELKYCRIIRRSFKNGHKYFLQLIMEGFAPLKFTAEHGETGQDPGISNSSFYGDNYCGFETLSKGCEKYEKRIRQASVKYERRRRMANPQNYNPDGTIKRGVKLMWKWTKGIRRALFELKDAYRRKSFHIKNYNGWLSNQIVRKTSTLRQEEMDYRALAKKSRKPAERSDKESVVTNKQGAQKAVHKFRRKRRFGRSILRRAPGMFDKMLRDKVVRYGGKVIVLNPKITASSQVDHSTGKRSKTPLSQRTKYIDGQLVQRDLYSSYLNRYTDKNNILDLHQCVNNFPDFLKRQGVVVQKVRREGDSTGNFGLADFA